MGRGRFVLAGNRAWGGVTLGIPVEILLCRSYDLTCFGCPTDTQEQPLASKAEEETPQLTWRKGEKQVARQLLGTLPSTEINNEKHAPYLIYLLGANRVARVLWISSTLCLRTTHNPRQQFEVRPRNQRTGNDQLWGCQNALGFCSPPRRTPGRFCAIG